MQQVRHPVKIPKNIPIPIQTLVNDLCCTDELSKNVVDLVSAVVIPWDLDVDELCEKKRATNTCILQEVL